MARAARWIGPVLLVVIGFIIGRFMTPPAAEAQGRGAANSRGAAPPETRMHFIRSIHKYSSQSTNAQQMFPLTDKDIPDLDSTTHHSSGGRPA